MVNRKDLEEAAAAADAESVAPKTAEPQTLHDQNKTEQHRKPKPADQNPNLGVNSSHVLQNHAKATVNLLLKGARVANAVVGITAARKKARVRSKAKPRPNHPPRLVSPPQMVRPTLLSRSASRSADVTATAKAAIVMATAKAVAVVAMAEADANLRRRKSELRVALFSNAATPVQVWISMQPSPPNPLR